MESVNDLKNLNIHCALHSSASDEYIFEELHKNKNYVYAQDDAGRTLLHLACKYIRVDVIRKLLEFGADINQQDNFGRTALHYCMAAKLIAGTLILILNGANVNASDIFQQTPLFYACQYKSELMILLLLHYGADIEHTNIKKETVLLQMCAAKEDNFIQIIKLLVIMNANIYANDINGNTPGYYVMNNKLDEINYLFNLIYTNPGHREKQVDIIIENLNLIPCDDQLKWNDTFLHIICSNYQCYKKYQDSQEKFILFENIVEEVFSKSLNSSQCVYNFVHYMEIRKYIKDNVMVALREDIFGKEYIKPTVKHYNTYQILKILVKKTGIDINSRNYLGETALHLLCAKRNDADEFLKCVHLLIKNGADINISDNLDMTPFHNSVAIYKNNKYNNILLNHGADAKRSAYYFQDRIERCYKLNRTISKIDLQNYKKGFIKHIIYAAVNSFNKQLLKDCLQLAIENQYEDIVKYILENFYEFAVNALFLALSSSNRLYSSVIPLQKNKFFTIMHTIICSSVNCCTADNIKQFIPTDSDTSSKLCMKLFFLTEIYGHCNLKLNIYDENYRNCFDSPLCNSVQTIVFTQRENVQICITVSIASVLALCLMKGDANIQQRLNQLCSISEYDNSDSFKELKKLNKINFSNTTISVLEFLLADKNKSANFVRNDNVVNQLSSSDFLTTNAPIFCDIFKKKLSESLENRAEILPTLFSDLSRLGDLPL